MLKNSHDCYKSSQSVQRKGTVSALKSGGAGIFHEYDLLPGFVKHWNAHWTILKPQ